MHTNGYACGVKRVIKADQLESVMSSVAEVVRARLD